LHEEMVGSWEERHLIKYERARNIDPADSDSVFVGECFNRGEDKPEVKQKDYLR